VGNQAPRNAVVETRQMTWPLQPQSQRDERETLPPRQIIFPLVATTAAFLILHHHSFSQRFLPVAVSNPRAGGTHEPRVIMTRNTPNPFQANGSSEQPRESSHLPGRIAQQAHQQLAKLVEFTSEEKTSLNIDLPKYLPPEFTATRSGPARTTLTYIEGWKLKNLANKLFGFDGWSSSITDVTVDFMDVDHEGKVSVGVSIIVRVTLKDGSYHEARVLLTIVACMVCVSCF